MTSPEGEEEVIITGTTVIAVMLIAIDDYCKQDRRDDCTGNKNNHSDCKGGDFKGSRG